MLSRRKYIPDLSSLVEKPRIGKNIFTDINAKIHFTKDSKLNTKPLFKDRSEFSIKKAINIKSIIENVFIKSKKLSIVSRGKLNKKSWKQCQN